jgi:hypothetical protein
MDIREAERRLRELDAEAKRIGGHLHIGVPLDLLSERIAALREVQAEWCASGSHEDPDNSGCCIRCDADL